MVGIKKMFKTSDLEKVVNYLKVNDVQEFEIISSYTNFASPFGASSNYIKLFTNNDFDIQLFAEREQSFNKVLIIKTEKI